jgi:methylglyoxal synthase
MLSGPVGGDAQIAVRVAEGKTKLVLFFKDPVSRHPHEPDVLLLIRVCDVHNVPLATKWSLCPTLVDTLSNRL